jgi:signal transduction histidine kinase
MTSNSQIEQITSQQDKRLRALYHLAVELSALRTMESVLETALRHCLDLTESQFGFIGLVAETGKAMDVVEVQGFHADRTFYDRFHLIPLRPSIFAHVVLHNQPVRSDDARIDPHRIGQPKGHPPVLTFLGVPLRHRDSPIGMIGVANRYTPYEEEHEHLLMTYAAQVAIVISNAQLYEELNTAKNELEQKVQHRTQELERAKEALALKATQLRQLYRKTVDIQETERQRIAQDMHDGINQLLIGAMLELKSARQRISSNNLTQADVALESVHTILHDVDAEIKRVINDIRPPILDTLGFVPALRRYLQDFKQYASFPCNLTVEGEVVRLSERFEVNIYRLFQEALQNAYTHSQAQRVDIYIRFSPTRLALTVQDNGVGFDLEQMQRANRHRFGLITMQERARSMNGDLTILTRLGEGARVTLTIPMDEGYAL